MQSEAINILTIQFANEISQHEVPLFRGAINNSLVNQSILFHNHDGDGLRYAYPLIQYKQIKDKATIICIGRGTETINDLLRLGSSQLRLGKRVVDMRIQNIHIDQVQIDRNDKEYHYKLHNWLPLNSNNYKEYQGLDSMVSKIQLLERILIGNIMSLLKGINVHVDYKISLNITDITNQHVVYYKKVKLMTFDVEFKANIILPQWVGVGKNASVGYGVLTNKSKEK